MLNSYSELRITPHTLLKWKNTDKTHSQTGVFSLLLEHSSPGNHITCLLGDYPDQKNHLKTIMADIREVADTLEIKIPAKLSLQALKS